MDRRPHLDWLVSALTIENPPEGAAIFTGHKDKHLLISPPPSAVYRVEVIHTPDDPYGYAYYATAYRISDDAQMIGTAGDTAGEAAQKCFERIATLREPEDETTTYYVDDAGKIVVAHSVKV